MKIIQTADLTLEQKLLLFDLWNLEYPERIAYSEFSEFEVYLKGLMETRHFLLISEFNQIFGWAFGFVREEENWFGIIVNSKEHGKGFGRLLLKELKKEKSNLNGWVVDHSNDVKRNGELYGSPLDFYLKNGFLVVGNTRLENNVISAVKVKWESE